jgi:hypothetical protein
MLETGLKPDDVVEALNEFGQYYDETKEFPLDVAMGIVAELDEEAINRLSKAMGDRVGALRAQAKLTQAKPETTA